MCAGKSDTRFEGKTLPLTSPSNTGDQLDEDEDVAVLSQTATAAKQKGNALYQRAEHPRAVRLYTVSQCMMLLARHLILVVAKSMFVAGMVCQKRGDDSHLIGTGVSLCHIGTS